MKINKMMTGVLIVFLIVALASHSFAWCGRKDRPDPEKRIERIAKRLELTDEQKAKFEAHRDKMKEYKKDERGRIKELG